MVGDGPEFVAVTERGEEFHHVAVAHLAKDFGLALCGLLVAKPHLQHQDKSAQQLLLEKPAFFAAIGRHRHCPENTSPLAPDPSEASKTKALGEGAVWDGGRGVCRIGCGGGRVGAEDAPSAMWGLACEWGSGLAGVGVEDVVEVSCWHDVVDSASGVAKRSDGGGGRCGGSVSVTFASPGCGSSIQPPK